MTGEEYTAFLRARKPEVYIQNSSGVPVKWIVTRAYINGVSAKRHTDAENYSHDDTGFFPVAMLMTKEQAEKRQKELAEKAKPHRKFAPGAARHSPQRILAKCTVPPSARKSVTEKRLSGNTGKGWKTKNAPSLSVPSAGRNFSRNIVSGSAAMSAGRRKLKRQVRK